MARLRNTARTKMLTNFCFQHCGIYAGDADSYKDFAEVFDPIIQVPGTYLGTYYRYLPILVNPLGTYPYVT